MLSRGKPRRRRKQTEVCAETSTELPAELPPTAKLSLKQFDPLGIGIDPASFRGARGVEIMTGRLAMLAAIGIPTAEFYHDQITEAFGLPSLLTSSGQVPMWLNGGSLSPIVEVIIGLSFVGLVAAALDVQSRSAKINIEFDPMNPDQLRQPSVSPLLKSILNQAQIVNGRVAMVAVVSIIAQEAMTGQAVVSVP